MTCAVFPDKPSEDDTREGLCDTETVSTGGTEETDEVWRVLHTHTHTNSYDHRMFLRLPFRPPPCSTFIVMVWQNNNLTITLFLLFFGGERLLFLFGSSILWFQVISQQSLLALFIEIWLLRENTLLIFSSLLFSCILTCISVVFSHTASAHPMFRAAPWSGPHQSDRTRTPSTETHRQVCLITIGIFCSKCFYICWFKQFLKKKIQF